ncbi:MAG: hypothetical protein ACE5GS_09070, partial [Kiloniellaceae bacterium]
MLRVNLGVFAMALVTLMVEIVLIRTFDVILTPNIGYMIITSAMFAFGLGGIYMALRPLPPDRPVEPFVAKCALGFGVSAALLLPVMNWLPFDYNELTAAPLTQSLSFLAMYLALIVPFFCSGLVFTAVFSAYARNIQTLYFFDLVGAGLGCVFFIPFIAQIGPGGLMFTATAIALVASALFAANKAQRAVLALAAVVVAAVPFARAPEIFDFRIHLDKRGVREALEAGRVEFTRWDPISRIDIVRQDRLFVPETGTYKSLHIAYDGGSQSSRFYAFDGDFSALRKGLEDGSSPVSDHFWFEGVLASHYLKEGTPYSALIIGSAGGQEMKAALTYGAARVDAVEMVGTVIELGKGRYAEYTGNLFHDPRINVVHGEGRAFLRASPMRYDVIQIFSNHTSSSLAAGTAAMQTVYLQTVEAYREYFEHLQPDGVLHINHHVYPRMITTAAAAWRQMGRGDFQRHVVVFERQGKTYDTLPTVLIKMSPWTQADLDKLEKLFADAKVRIVMVENPLNPSESFLRPEFYSGDFPEELVRDTKFRMAPATDDRPFFNFLRAALGPVQADPATFMSASVAGILNAQLRSFVPMDVVHLIVTTGSSIFFAVAFILVPMYFSRVGRASWPRKHNVLIYFACLGFAFIVIELTFVQVFMKLIGRPLHTFSTVLFAMLLAAGLGSLCSGRLGISVNRRWLVPFIGVFAAGLGFFAVHDPIFGYFLAAPLPVRILAAVLLIFPVGFFLGMPFPLGILALQGLPQGAVAWAWALNGVFTVLGGVASVLLGIYVGFSVSLLIAFALYGIALWNFVRMRAIAAAPAGWLAREAA